MSDSSRTSVEEPAASDPGKGAPTPSSNGSEIAGDGAEAAPSTSPAAGEESGSGIRPPSVTESGPQPPTYFGLSRGDAWFALVVGGAILMLMLIHWGRLAWRGEPRVEIDRLQPGAYEFQLEINRATWVEWMQLEEIGETLARRIVADREERGPFRSVDDLGRVSGIGPKTLDAIRPHLRCRDCPSPSETPP